MFAYSESDDRHRKRDNWDRFPAKDRGTVTPLLKLQFSPDEVEPLNIVPAVNIPKLDLGYYDMSNKKHGVCLIINNENFEVGLGKRAGTERDEYNLIQTWQYLGYHVEVRRDLTFGDIQDIFMDIDAFLYSAEKNSPDLANDSFVCCVLSHGDKTVIYGTDIEPVTIECMEAGLGASKKLRGRPKMFFIQACQGGKFDTIPVDTKLHVRTDIQSDGGIQTSRRDDTYISYAAAPGNSAYRSVKRGSLYVRTLCKTLCEKSKSNPLDQMQMIVNRVVSEEFEFVTESGAIFKQQPGGHNQLNFNVHFFS